MWAGAALQPDRSPRAGRRSCPLSEPQQPALGFSVGRDSFQSCASRLPERPRGCTFTGLTLPEQKGQERCGGGLEAKAGQAPEQAAPPPPILLADRQGTRLAIRENQNPSPRGARQAVVQVFTELVKLSILFCGNVFFCVAL